MRFLFLILAAAAPLILGQNYTVKFNVITPSADSGMVYISGSHPSLGNWNPARVPMERLRDSLWTLTLEFPAGTAIEYKFTKGSWDTEAVDESGTAPANSSLTVNADTVLTARIYGWKTPGASVFTGGITGNVRYHEALTYDGLKARSLIVWLPPGYDSTSAEGYPVIYFQDGQNVFDPATSTFGIDWQIDETADSLIRSGRMEKVIIVGIYNTPDRRREYTPNDTGCTYMKFVVNKVKPFIDSVYNTKPEREFTAAAGSSAGGLISFMLLWEYPEVFSMAAAMSPAFKIENIDYVTAVKEAEAKKPVKIYIDNGGTGLEARLQPGVDHMLEALKDKGYAEGEDLIWKHFPEASHSERDWALRVYIPLLYFFGTK